MLFAARWRREFLYDSVSLPFTNGDGAKGVIDALGDPFFMPYAKAEHWEAVRLAYDDVLAMDVILPRPGTHPSELNLETVDASSTALGQVDDLLVTLTIPPSDIKTKWDLLQPLADQEINLSQMEGIFDGATTSQMAQQVRLIVTAKGTVGAAVTEVTVATSSGPVVDVELVIDRPFIMRVLDTRTGWLLFPSIVNDPTNTPG